MEADVAAPAGTLQVVGEQMVLRPAGGDSWTCPLVPFRVEFDGEAVDAWEIEQIDELGPDVVVVGSSASGGMRFEIRWREILSNVITMDLTLRAEDPKWTERAPTVVLLDSDPDDVISGDVGWREADSPAAIRALSERPPEEGGGFLPPYGYPVFGRKRFFGIAHPMGCMECEARRLRAFHHPQWVDGRISSPSLVIGLCRVGQSPKDLFRTYFQTVRRPRPDRAIVEINTFWTDVYDTDTGYTTDRESYLRMAQEWSRRVLAGEHGLVSHFLLDAGWQDIASIYCPRDALGGPGDAGLLDLADQIRAEGFQFGLWFTLNGPIGIDIDWAAANGFRTSNRGAGAGYASAGGKLKYVCLTDPDWEAQFSARMEALISGVEVDFMKGDWDNDAVEDPGLNTAIIPTLEHQREAIADAMIRIYARMHSARDGFGLRGAWWPSPWWFPHVDNTHLPNSGDMESTDLPSSTQRDAGLTCRDSVFHHVMRTCETPVDIDLLVPHEFAHSRRNPVFDTEESWTNNLMMWLCRGTHYLQIYAAPYDIHEDRAWALREALRWFRANEDLLWKQETRMIGGNPGVGEVYGYLHGQGGRQLLVVRNPLPHPQSLAPVLSEGIDLASFATIYPVCLPAGCGLRDLAGHEVRVLEMGGKDEFPVGFVHRRHASGIAFSSASNALRHGFADAVPELHRISSPSAVLESDGKKIISIHASLPDGLASAEVVIRCRSLVPGDTELRASLGRYPDPTATFPVAVTALRSGMRQGYALRRLRSFPCDPNLVIFRIPIGSGGDAHLYIDSLTTLPQVDAAWIEAREVVLEAAFRPELGTLPPASSHPPRVVCHISLS